MMSYRSKRENEDNENDGDNDSDIDRPMIYVCINVLACFNIF
jgi:hypothetical protein